MATLVDSNPITIGGTYDLPRLIPGKGYLIALKSDSTFSAYLDFFCPAANDYKTAEDSGFNTAATEKRFIAPDPKMRIVVDSITTPVFVTLTMIG